MNNPEEKSQLARALEYVAQVKISDPNCTDGYLKIELFLNQLLSEKIVATRKKKVVKKKAKKKIFRQSC